MVSFSGKLSKGVVRSCSDCSVQSHLQCAKCARGTLSHVECSGVSVHFEFSIGTWLVALLHSMVCWSRKLKIELCFLSSFDTVVGGIESRMLG